jgi:DNA-binding GntR family transcriptional regulator
VFAVIAQTIGTANAIEQKKLRLSQEPVLRLVRTRRDASQSISHEQVVLAPGRFPGLSTDSELTSDLLELARRHNVALGSATESVCAVPANKDVAAHLELDEAERLWDSTGS